MHPLHHHRQRQASFHVKRPFWRSKERPSPRHPRSPGKSLGAGRHLLEGLERTKSLSNTESELGDGPPWAIDRLRCRAARSPRAGLPTQQGCGAFGCRRRGTEGPGHDDIGSAAWRIGVRRPLRGQPRPSRRGGRAGPRLSEEVGGPRSIRPTPSRPGTEDHQRQRHRSTPTSEIDRPHPRSEEEGCRERGRRAPDRPRPEEPRCWASSSSAGERRPRMSAELNQRSRGRSPHDDAAPSPSDRVVTPSMFWAAS